MIRIESSEAGVTSISLNIKSANEKENPNNWTRKCASQLTEYFGGMRKEFELAYDFNEGTDFQKKVWSALLEIPFGKTVSYLELSDKLGNKKAIRAVGAANGKNPIAICVPCHRVIGSDGSLVGYASGLDIKRSLLMHENPRVFGKQIDLFAN